MPSDTKIEEYDAEPVRYCSKCYSLKVKYEEALDSECCSDCGCMDIVEAPVEVWEKLYEKRYGHKFIVKNEDPEKSYVFNLPLEKLKTKVFNSPKWKEIIRSMYRHFPSGYSKTDSIILFFDTVIRQNRLKELRLLLYKYFKY